MKIIRLLPLTLALLVPALHADFKFDQSSDITGGAMMGAMKMAGKFSKQAKMPMVTTTLFKGKRMAQRSPYNIVVTDVGDSAWIVGETGVVVPPRDPKALADALRECLERDREKTAQSARARVVEKFSVKRLIDETERALWPKACRRTCCGRRS